MIYFFDEYSLDPGRRELRRAGDVVAVEPQVFDLLEHLIHNRSRVVDKDELIAEVWRGRVVSESTLSSRMTAARQAVRDSGVEQRLIRTLTRKGFRFVGTVREDALLDNEASDEVIAAAKPLLIGSSATAHLAPAERRPVTIVVSGLAEASKLAAHVDPEDLREIIASYCHNVRQIVEWHGGRIVRYADDGVVAYFGYPQAHEDDAERAVRAGLAAAKVEAAGEMRGRREPLLGHVGIASGLVLVDGSPGGDWVVGQAITGETPHVAASLQRLAGIGEVIISASTRRLVGNLFEYRELEAASADLSASLVLAESRIASRFEALRPSRNRLIGREDERELLLRRWRQASAGEGRVVLIWGEPGIGKSHLVAAFQDEIRGDPHTSLRYFCSPHRMQTALHPVITQLEHAADFATDDDDRTKLDKLERLLSQSSHAGDDNVPLFADLLSIPTGGHHAALALSSQRRKELLLESFLAQLDTLARREPVLMVLEDAHWIDPTTRELFDLVVGRIRGLRALLIMTYRPEFVPPWLGQSHVTALTLNRLGPRENAALVRQTAGGRDLPPPIVEQIVARTDGVPLFVEEVTKSILESGVLREEHDAYVLDTSVPAVAVPSTLQASLVARLDRIPAARAVVQTGSALGRDFRYSVLKSVAALSDSELAPLLDQVVTSGLVHQRGEPPHALYTFKHALVQDAAYETIPRRERPGIHRRIVDALEQAFPDITEHHPDVLAYHCTEAALPKKAIEFRINAARIALSRSAGVEAQSQVETAMSLLAKIAGPDRQQIEGRLQVALGEALLMTRGFAAPEVKDALSRARELLEETVQPIEALVALGGLFNYHLIRSESPACLALAEPRLRKDLDRPTATVVHYLVGTAHLHLGNFAQSIDHLEKARALYDEEICRPLWFIAGIHLRSFILVWLGLAYLFVGRLGLAGHTISAAVSDARSRSHPFTLVSALLALARFRNHTRDLAGAIAATEEGMAIATEQRSPYHVSRAAVLRAINVVESGRPQEGIELMESALAAHRATGANFQSSYNLSRLAEAHASAGNLARAADFAKQAVAEVERTGERWWQAEAERIRGEILLRGGRNGRREAEACFARALKCARGQKARLWELHAALSLATLCSAEGEDDKARALLGPVCRAFEDGYVIDAISSARKLLDAARSTTGSRSAARRRRRR
ncbi:MAG TPA: AAA family ATPase [Casimicrobiaceae bacterium]|nr:AAA family ATPase [Casimicrobiaceae bacterium]